MPITKKLPKTQSPKKAPRSVKRIYDEAYPRTLFSDSPEVDKCIDACLAAHTGVGPAALARYFEAVHQELAPLARKLERENAQLREQLRGPRLVK